MGMSLSKLREFVIDREAWRATIHGVAKSQTWLSDWTELNPYQTGMRIKCDGLDFKALLLILSQRLITPLK